MKFVASAIVLSLVLVGCLAPAPGASPTPPGQALPSPTETVPAAETVGPEVVDAARMRHAFGLRSDIEWVLAVEAGPESVMSELGFMVTPAEDAELRRRFEGQDRMDRLVAYGAENPDTFGGLYIDQAAGGVVVMLFTADHERHADAVAALAPGGLRVRLVEARHTEAELMELIESIDFDALGREGYELNSAGIDTRANVVRIEAKANLPNAKARLEERFGGKVVADIFPVPGPWQNRGAGEGWRLLAAGRTDASQAYTVHVATDEAQWTTLWDELQWGEAAADVDLTTEIVATFGHGIGSTCTELRLDDVVIDEEGSIHSVTSDPLAPRACTADLAGAVVFVVAIERDALPQRRFTVDLSEHVFDCDDCQERVEVSLDD